MDTILQGTQAILLHGAPVHSITNVPVRAGDTRIYVLLSHYLGVSLLAMDIAPFARGTQAFVFCYRTA